MLRELGKRIVGPGKVLDPAHIQHVFVSPRSRAQKTFQLLFEEQGEKAPSFSLEEGVREWDYGVCEGAWPGPSSRFARFPTAGPETWCEIAADANDSQAR